MPIGLRRRPDASRSRAGAGLDPRFVLFLVFLVLVFVTGGGGRHDIVSLVILRPASVIFLVAGLLMKPAQASVKTPSPLFMLAALAAVIAAQLLPLPPGIWQSLPGRVEMVPADKLADLPGIWRPLSLSPARTLNALFSLAVPAAAVILYRNLSAAQRELVPAIIVGGGVVSIAWGWAQLVGGPDSIFHTYRIHTADRPTGAFANRNHSAMFLALTMLFAVWNIVRLPDVAGRRVLKLIALISYIAIVVLTIFILGSRAGLLLGAFAGFLGAVLVSFAPWLRQPRPHTTKHARGGKFVRLLPTGRAFATVGIIAALLLLGTVAVMFGRGEAFSRLSDGDVATPFDRSDVLPFLLRMAGDHWVWGSGFGSFDALFARYESISMLSTTYLNQAHNDWLQIVIEGGLGGAVVLAMFIVWLLRCAIATMRSELPGARVARTALLATFVAIGFASLVDYPLRVPILMVVMILAACLLGEPEAFHRSARREDRA